MLVDLSIRDIVLIEKLDLHLGSGLSVLTGETGAGKSILLDAFAFALGSRGDGALVREGARQGQVTARFDLRADHPALTAAQRFEIASEGELVLRRVQMADGRTRAAINDQPVSAQALRAVGSALVEIHGQHDDRAFMDASLHRALLDAFGGHGDQVADTRAAFEAWRTLEAEQAAEAARVSEARREADYLRHAAEELAKLGPEAGEELALSERRATMMGAEKVVGELREAQDAVAGDHGPIVTIAAVLRRLERRATQAPDLVEPPIRALDLAIEALERAGETLDQALDQAAFDPKDLERVEERLFALRAASRKYAVAVDDLPAKMASFEASLAALDAGEARLVRLVDETAAALARFQTAAQALSEARHRAASDLDHAVVAELAPLRLERARFITQLRTDGEQATADGIDRVEFWVQTNPGTRAGPLMKVASGGELARFMLALKVVLADRGSAPTLVFDEIDTGVGGAVADAIGQRLSRLATRVQVLAVTHAPQVAARAAGHFQIAKTLDGERAATQIVRLDPDSRREEIARMLAGASVTNEARAAARRLINAAK